MNLVFFGSSSFSVVVLQKLLDAKRFTLDAVITTPDKPVGRHLKLTPNPVKLLAQKHNLQIIETMNDLMTMYDNCMTSPIGIVAAYGKIIPKSVLDKFNGQIYNIHPSLLPKYRGPSPLQQQILDGITQTGVTILQVDSQMDHGPIVLQSPDTISPNDTWITLGERLFAKGADLILNSQFSILNQIPKPQNHKEATYTSKITRQSGFVEFEKLKNCLDLGICDLDIARMHRAFADWPGIWTLDPSNRRLKLVSLNPVLIQYAGQKPQPWN